ncbi:MAG: hypothetical protein AB1782_04440 [Cyanobacteriota bacterium]
MLVNSYSTTLSSLKNRDFSTTDKPLYLKRQHSLDSIAFGLNSRPNLREIFDEIDKTPLNTWKKSRKSDTKISSARVYDHPEYGKVKVGLTIAYRDDLTVQFQNGYKVKAFIEVPKYKISNATVNEDSGLFNLAQRIIGNDTYQKLKSRVEKEHELSLKKYDEMTRPFKRKKERHKLNVLA